MAGNASNNNIDDALIMSVDFNSLQAKFAEAFRALFLEVNYVNSAVMGIRHEDTSGSTTDDRNVTAHAEHVERVIRGFLDEVDMGHLTRSSSRDKTEFKRVFDTIVENIKDFVIDDTKNKTETFEDIFERAKASFAGLLDETEGEAAACFAAVARFIPSTIIRRHNSWLTDRQEFERLLQQVAKLVQLKCTCEDPMVETLDPEVDSRTSSGSGISALKLASARKRRVEDELYKLFGTTYSNQSSSASLTIPEDLATQYLGSELLENILVYMRAQVLSFPLPLVYVQYMRDSYRSEMGIQLPDFSTLPEAVIDEFNTQNRMLYKLIYDLMSQPLRDRLDNTHSFAQSCPTVTITGGIKKYDGVSLCHSLSFLHREDHSVLESRVRGLVYSAHLAMKSQPLLEVVEEVRKSLALARKHAVRLSWSESGMKMVDVVASRSILLGQAMAPFGHTGKRRSELQDPNDCLPLLFDLVDAIERSTLMAEQAEDNRGVSAAFQIGNPGVRAAWNNAIHPPQAGHADRGARYTGANKGKGFSKGKGKGFKGKPQFKPSLNKPYKPPGPNTIRRCPAIGCTQLLTTRRMRTVCDTCYTKSLTSPIRLTQGRTFPDKGKGGTGKGARPLPFGRAPPAPPRNRAPYSREGARQVYGAEMSSQRAPLAEKVPPGRAAPPPCHTHEALGASMLPPPTVPCLGEHAMTSPHMQEVNTQWDQTPPRGSPRSPTEDPPTDSDDERPIGASDNLQVHMALSVTRSRSDSESSDIVQEQEEAPADGGSMVTQPRSRSPSLTSREGSVTGGVDTVVQSTLGSGQGASSTGQQGLAAQSASISPDPNLDPNPNPSLDPTPDPSAAYPSTPTTQLLTVTPDAPLMPTPVRASISPSHMALALHDIAHDDEDLWCHEVVYDVPRFADILVQLQGSTPLPQRSASADSAASSSMPTQQPGQDTPPQRDVHIAEVMVPAPTVPAVSPLLHTNVWPDFIRDATPMSPGTMDKIHAHMEQPTGASQGDRYFNFDTKQAATQLLQDAVAPTASMTAALSKARLPFSTKRAYLMNLDHEDDKADAVIQDFVNRDTPTPPTSPVAALRLTQPQVNAASKMHTSLDCWCGATTQEHILQPTPPYIAPAPPLLPIIPSQPPLAPVPRQVAMTEMATAPARTPSTGSFNPSLSSLFSLGSLDSATLRASVDPDLAAELGPVSEADLAAIISDDALVGDFVSLFCDPEEVASHMGLGDCVGDIGNMSTYACRGYEHFPYPDPSQPKVTQATDTSSELLEADTGRVTGRKRRHDKMDPDGCSVTYDEHGKEIILID